jgi:hypothetical protein
MKPQVVLRSKPHETLLRGSLAATATDSRQLQMLNATPETEAEIREQANRGFARLRRQPDLLLGFFHYAGLRVKRLI